MLKILKNPKSEAYLRGKQLALSDQLLFNWSPSNTGHYYYSHNIINKPDSKLYHSHGMSEHTALYVAVINNILHANNLATNGFHIFRANINVVHPSEGEQFSEPHKDHCFPHVNLIAYFSDVGGRTFCEGEEHDPQEDDVILFEGEHYMEKPKTGRRVILVSTLQIY